MQNSILNAPTPDQFKLELLRQHFPQAVETDAQGRIRINASALQLALDPSNPAGIQVEEDGYELRWVGKREAYHSAFLPVQKIIAPLPDDSKHWDTTGNLLIKGDNLDALRLLRQSYFGKVKLIYIDPPYNTQSDAFIYRDDFSAKQSEVLAQLGYTADITQDGTPQALYLVVETKGYDDRSEIPVKEKWKIDSARQFFKALQELPELKDKGVQIRFESKINGERLAQLISSMK